MEESILFLRPLKGAVKIVCTPNNFAWTI